MEEVIDYNYLLEDEQRTFQQKLDYVREHKDKIIIEEYMLDDEEDSKYLWTYFGFVDTQSEEYQNIYPVGKLTPENFKEELNKGNMPGVIIAAKRLKESFDHYETLRRELPLDDENHNPVLDGQGNQVTKTALEDIWGYNGEIGRSVEVSEEERYITMSLGWTKQDYARQVHLNGRIKYNAIPYGSEDIKEIHYPGINDDYYWFPEGRHGDDGEVIVTDETIFHTNGYSKLYYQALYYLLLVGGATGAKMADY